MKNKSVLFIVPYPIHKAPSQRFRVELFEPYLVEANIKYKIAPFIDAETWARLYKRGSFLQKVSGIFKGYIHRFKTTIFEAPRYDYIFIHRESAPLGPPLFEWLISKIFRKKLIYDFDDAIWMPNTSKENKLAAWLKSAWKVNYICKWSYKVSAGNKYLCDYALKHTKNVVYMPTCVDMQRMHNRIKANNTSKPVIGWTGSHSTLPYLQMLVDVIRDLQQKLDFTFLVIADKKPDLSLSDWEFLPWDEHTEIDDLLKMDIGIMPLQSDAWSEGKCGFKIIQYLSLGIPAVASPVGVNITIIQNGINGFLCNTPEEWKNSLALLINDTNMRQQMGEKGRKYIQSSYSTEAHAQTFISLFS